MRLIDADKLIELCNIMADKCDEIGEGVWHQFRTIVEWSQTIDAGLKFHCRDCIYYERHEEGGSGGTCSNTKFWMPEDGYCSDGETELRDEED